MTSGQLAGPAAAEGRAPEPERLRRWRLLLGSPAEQGLGLGVPGSTGPAGGSGGSPGMGL